MPSLGQRKKRTTTTQPASFQRRVENAVGSVSRTSKTSGADPREYHLTAYSLSFLFFFENLHVMSRIYTRTARVQRGSRWLSPRRGPSRRPKSRKNRRTGSPRVRLSLSFEGFTTWLLGCRPREVPTALRRRRRRLRRCAVFTNGRRPHGKVYAR